MPICEADPWRMQYFEGAACPPGVNVPTEDADAWEWNPEFRWIYDKIAIARNQGLDAGPHGTLPPSFPVFSKPIVNLKGMGVDTRIIHSAADYALHQTSGHMWMTMLEGRHVSTDVAIVGGERRWWRHVTGQSAGEGTFDHWTVHADREPEIERYCGEWIARHLRGYTGMLNIETIGGRMIEMHLRFSDQWPDLHGPGWVQALVGLYAAGDGTSPMTTGARATALCCSGRRAGITGIRRGALSTRCCACRASPACRPPSTKIGIRSGTPCRPAAFASRSSIVGIARWDWPPASGCAPFICRPMRNLDRCGRLRCSDGSIV